MTIGQRGNGRKRNREKGRELLGMNCKCRKETEESLVHKKGVNK